MRVLADTSVWIDHFRSDNDQLAELLTAFSVVTHPFVVGELACGNLRNRAPVVEHLHRLPGTTVASDIEVLAFIENNRLMGRGIGYVDAHLLAAAALMDSALILTRDRRLKRLAAELGLAFPA